MHGCQNTANMSFQIFAHPDQAFSSAYQNTNTLRRFTPNMNLAEPTGAREMRQTFGIPGIRFVDPD